MKKLNTRKGQRGEQIAAAFLEAQGYQIVEKNYRYRRGEIDLIALDQDVLVFVEVKWRSSSAYGYPEEAVSEKKRNLLLQTSEQYIFEKDWQQALRYDIVAIVEQQGKPTFEHLKDVFF